MDNILEYDVEQDDAGKTVGVMIKQAFGLSKRAVIRLKRHPQGILINGRHVTVRYVVQKGDRLQVTLDDEALSMNGERYEMIPVAMKLDILYEDKDYLAVNKPANMPVHPSRGHGCDSLGNGVIYYLKQKGERTQTFRPITRLDRDTSGIVLIAKHAYAQSQLNADTMEKMYLALITGHLKGEGIIEAPIGRETPDSLKRKVDAQGKYARTDYQVIGQGENCTLLKIQLKTGRTHQIRVHFAHIGHPLLGDSMYGGDCQIWQRQALHAYQLSFIHPITGEKVCIRCPFEALDDDAWIK